ncbi:MAG: bifunctional enoyl-CoA hydratase/phosphate acetyltransferase [Treponemataceae bacterium]
MIKNFDELLKKVAEGERKTIGVACAEDMEIVEVVRRCESFADFILVGDKQKILKLFSESGPAFAGEIIDESDNRKAAERAVQLVKEKKVQTLMKGLVQSGTFLKAILNKEKGLNEGKLISQVSVFEKDSGGFFFLTDCAIAVKPTLDEKRQIIENAVDLARRLGYDIPKVAVLAAVETVNPDMPETLDAAALSKMAERGQIKNAIVDGPLALDNAVDAAAAKHKGIGGSVAGNADILLVPDLLSGNMLTKALTYIAKKRVAAAMMGVGVPVVFTSRAESIENKILTIALSALIGR